LVWQLLETQRLTLRRFQERDVDELFAIMSDGVAMQHTYIAKSREECANRLRTYAASESTLGYAPWTVILRAEAKIIGWGGLNIDPFDPDWGSEVSYCFDPAYWGKGYATELVQAALQVGFDSFSLPLIAAFASPQNPGSIRVLEKCGFTFVRYLVQMQRNYYELDQNAFIRLESSLS
jgi:[ribosomal protein S5]-alanine N-acetyltransferase